MPVTVVLALQLGLGRPLHRRRIALAHRAASPLWERSAGITPPSATTSRLTPRRALVCFSHGVMASPTRLDRSADRASAPVPGDTGWRRIKELPGPCEVSLDHFVTTFATVCRNHLSRPLCLGRSDGAGRITGRTGGTGSSASPLRGGSPPRPALHRFTARSDLRHSLRPLRTPSRLDALGISYRTSTTKAREGLAPTCWRSCQAYTRSRGAFAPLELGLAAQDCTGKAHVSGLLRGDRLLTRRMRASGCNSPGGPEGRLADSHLQGPKALTMHILDHLLSLVSSDYRPPAGRGWMAKHLKIA